ncbi:MAG: Rossmann-like domain-containing protein [Planctomycetota bacterium]|jgi:hypothetical protein
MTSIETLYERLIYALRDVVVRHRFLDETVAIRCQALSAEEAIGRPEDKDYPVIKGCEKFVEADFKGAKGQAFTDDYGNSTVSLRALVEKVPDTTRKRAEFIAVFNAVYRHLGLVDHTVHCKDDEPRECAKELATRIRPGMKVLLVGLQPRMLEVLAALGPVRCLDLDADHIGEEKSGITIEAPGMTDEAIEWCQVILATGSTIVNGTLPTFLDRGKPVIFYGVTISTAALILGLDSYCWLAK